MDFGLTLRQSDDLSAKSRPRNPVSLAGRECTYSFCARTGPRYAHALFGCGQGGFHGLAISTDGQVLARSSEDGTICPQDAPGGRLLARTGGTSVGAEPHVGQAAAAP